MVGSPSVIKGEGKRTGMFANQGVVLCLNKKR